MTTKTPNISALTPALINSCYIMLDPASKVLFHEFVKAAGSQMHNFRDRSGKERIDNLLNARDMLDSAWNVMSYGPATILGFTRDEVDLLNSDLLPFMVAPFAKVLEELVGVNLEKLYTPHKDSYVDNDVFA